MKKALGIILGLLAIISLIGSIVIISIMIYKNNNKENKSETKYVIITFDTDGGNTVDEIKIKKGDPAELPLTSKEGYAFVGWYLDNELINETHKYQEDTTLKAKWLKSKKGVTYNVTFDTKGGNKINSVTLVCNTPIELPSNPTKDGYTFVSWADKHGKVIGNGALLTCENITLYANWIKKETIVEKTVSESSFYSEIYNSGEVVCDPGYYVPEGSWECVKMPESSEND